MFCLGHPIITINLTLPLIQQFKEKIKKRRKKDIFKGRNQDVKDLEECGKSLLIEVCENQIRKLMLHLSKVYLQLTTHQ